MFVFTRIGGNMGKRNDIEVTIGGKKLNLCGYESAEYLHKLANYMNEKLEEFKRQDFYRMLEPDMRNLLMQINMADDYFKAKMQLEELEQNTEGKTTEIFDLRHELVLVQTKLENAELELDVSRQENLELQKKIVRLETELEERKRYLS